MKANASVREALAILLASADETALVVDGGPEPLGTLTLHAVAGAAVREGKPGEADR